MRIESENDMVGLGRRIGTLLRGGESIELVGDVGAGKTTLVKGIGEALMADDIIQSPSFTISREYTCRDDIRLAHYDFYRLHDAGVLQFELAESLTDPQTVTVVEWAETIGAVLPEDRIIVSISSTPDDEARIVDVVGLDV